jgi:hypothetical protein
MASGLTTQSAQVSIVFKGSEGGHEDILISEASGFVVIIDNYKKAFRQYIGGYWSIYAC